LVFDSTSERTPFGFLQTHLQENRGLLVIGESGELIDFPTMPRRPMRGTAWC
jgi:hypothetical protein